MRIIGLLSWYDEDPLWLSGAVVGAGGICDHVVALDGAYELFPDGKPHSPNEQVEAILGAAHFAEIGCTIQQPQTLWTGNQIEKRNALFRLASSVAEPGDWYFVFDADDLVVSVPADARTRLYRATEDVAVYTFTGDRYHRGFFRAFPSLRVEDAHYHYIADRGRKTIHLRGNDAVHKLEPFMTLTGFRVQHRKSERSPERAAAIAEYHRRIAERGIEKTTPEQWAVV